VASEVQHVLRRLTVYGASLPCTPLHMQLEKRRSRHYCPWRVGRQVHVVSDVRRQRPELAGDLPHDPGPRRGEHAKEERRKLLSYNPLIATMHYFERESAFWKDIIGGEARPIGKVTERWVVRAFL
jgi:hypothetical protein